MSTETFVLIGKNQGRTMSVGPAMQPRQFINGECEVPTEDVSKVANSLRFYCAFPKDSAPKYHAAACAKLGIDPVTLQPLAAGASAAAPAPAPAQAPAPAPAAPGSTLMAEEPRPAIPEPAAGEVDTAIENVLMALENENDDHWTQTGVPQMSVIRDRVGPALAPYVNRQSVSKFGIVRSGKSSGAQEELSGVN